MLRIVIGAALGERRIGAACFPFGYIERSVKNGMFHIRTEQFAACFRKCLVDGHQEGAGGHGKEIRNRCI